MIEKQRREVRTQKKKPIQIQFLKEGETTRRNIRNDTKSGILDQAKDWQLEVDLDRKLTFRDCTNELKTGHGFVVGSNEENRHHRVDRPLGR